MGDKHDDHPELGKEPETYSIPYESISNQCSYYNFRLSFFVFCYRCRIVTRVLIFNTRHFSQKVLTRNISLDPFAFMSLIIYTANKQII